MHPEQYKLSTVTLPDLSPVDSPSVGTSGSQVALVFSSWDTDAQPVAQQNLGTIGRGNKTEINFYHPKIFNSEFSGNLVDLCYAKVLH